MRRLMMVALVAGTCTGAEPFRDGDTVCLIGDSITHVGTYHAYVQLFYATRYPTRNITWFNCGHSGGSAGECLQRLQWDILDHHPTAATVSFGMNDMGGLYAEPVEDNIAKRVNGVARTYETLLDKLTAAGVRLTLVGPSTYDDTAKLERKIERSNLAMTRWTQRLGELATQRGAGFVDLGAVMNPVNARLQAADPKATLVGGDRVHPGAVGHAVMAFAVLTAQGVTPDVARLTVDAATGQAGPLVGCTLEGVTRDGGRLSFTCREQALPFVLPPAAAKALKLVPFTDQLNRELLTVTGLPAGNYTLSIDDTAVATCTAAELAAGVNLATNAKTPQYQQALALARLHDQRNGLESNVFRCKAFVRHALLTKAKIDPADDAAVKQFLETRLAGKTAANFTYDDYMSRAYLKDVAGHWDEAVKRHTDLLARLAIERQPKPHRFVLAPAA